MKGKKKVEKKSEKREKEKEWKLNELTEKGVGWGVVE